jgi:heme A synthase
MDSIPRVTVEGSIDGWRRLAIASFAVTYVLIVLGGVVRITGSGMGCGDHWPMCNGEWFPPMDLPTLIEWSHRLVAAMVSALVVALAGWALLRRRSPGWAARARFGLAALALLVVQILLGAVTVWLELPPPSVIFHLGTAMLLLSVVLLAALGAADAGAWEARGGPVRMAISLAVLVGVVVLLGALVANLGAAPACQGFPLCNGSLLPGGHWRIHLHWTHRVAAYLAVLGVVALPGVGDGRARATAWLAALLAVLQVVVAAVMVLRLLPAGLQATHLAVGTALFATLVAHAYRAGRIVAPA